MSRFKSWQTLTYTVYYTSTPVLYHQIADRRRKGSEGKIILQEYIQIYFNGIDYWVATIHPIVHKVNFFMRKGKIIIIIC